MPDDTVMEIDGIDQPFPGHEEIERMIAVASSFEKKFVMPMWNRIQAAAFGTKPGIEAKKLGAENIVAVAVGEQQKRGVTTGKLSVKVYTEFKTSPDFIEEDAVVPESWEGFPVDVEQIGYVHAFDPRFQPTQPLAHSRQRFRPAMGGVSISHYPLVTAGTFGCLCTSTEPRETALILSNNHVLAASNEGKIGDPIVQPGKYDGGKTPEDLIAKLFDYVPIKFDGQPNLADAALAKPVDDKDVRPDILGIGSLRGAVCKSALNTQVKKMGRTTHLTQGSITGLNATVRVSYGDAGTALFRKQYIIGTPGFSAGGDSGSLIVDIRNCARALLFAGSTTHTIANPICTVLEELSAPARRIKKLRIRIR